jgi:hypothetical protein
LFYGNGKNIVILFTNDNTFEIVGTANLPKELIFTKAYIVNINDINHILISITDQYIFNIGSPIKISVFKDINYSRMRQSNPYSSSLSRKTDDVIKDMFYQTLKKNMLNFKPYFRKNKISKLLEEEV